MDAETFLGHLYAALHPTWAAAGVAPQTPGAYSAYIFPALTTAAQAAAHEPRWSGAGHELLYDMAWLPRNGGTFRLPAVVIEHENQTSPHHFLVDQRKLLVGWAPLRVMIGYVPPGHGPEERVETLQLAAAEGHWAYPDGCADLALVGPYQMGTPRDYLIIHRPAGAATFAPRGWLRDLRADERPTPAP